MVRDIIGREFEYAPLVRDQSRVSRDSLSEGELGIKSNSVCCVKILLNR